MFINVQSTQDNIQDSIENQSEQSCAHELNTRPK